MKTTNFDELNSNFVFCFQVSKNVFETLNLNERENIMSKELETKVEVTGFQFHKLVNERLELEGLTMTSKEGVTSTKRIPPQMIYNYIKKGFIKTNSKGLIDLEEGNVWLEKYISNRIKDSNL